MQPLPPALIYLLQKAFSAEKAAALAYQGHACSVKDGNARESIRQIESDEWHHRASVLEIMKQHNVPVSKWLELKYYLIGKVISSACYIIGWFMPYYFAGKLESGNVCEYFRIMQLFYDSNILLHNEQLYEMGMKEKEHELFFLEAIRNKKWLPRFEQFFAWGNRHSLNDVDLDEKYPVEKARFYCGKIA